MISQDIPVDEESRKEEEEEEYIPKYIGNKLSYTPYPTSNNCHYWIHQKQTLLYPSSH